LSLHGDIEQVASTRLAVPDETSMSKVLLAPNTNPFNPVAETDHDVPLPVMVTVA
jgi:hypothetical protein